LIQMMTMKQMLSKWKLMMTFLLIKLRIPKLVELLMSKWQNRKRSTSLKLRAGTK
jgi:hypothetical protein